MKKREEDSLEKFIRQNKENLNQFELSDNVWEKIAAKLEKNQKGKAIEIKYTTLWRVAAIFVLLLGFYAAFQWNYLGFSGQNSLATRQQLEEINPELAEAEDYYTQLIDQKRKEIEAYPLAEYKLDSEFQQDISQLDSMYLKLKEELFKVPAKDKVMDAMILNLQMRIGILNQQLAILEKIQKIKQGKKDEKVNI